MATQIRRRSFILMLAGTLVALSLATGAQQLKRPSRIGVLMNLASDDQESQARFATFLQALHQSGWIEGHNVRIDTRWGAGDANRTRRYAAELVALAPDVIVAASTPALGPLQSATRTVPIVFVQVADPVGGGFVDNLQRPGGNMTGFSVFDYSIGTKWREPGSGSAGAGHGLWQRTVRCHPDGSGLVRGGAEPAQRTRHWRD